MQDYIEMPDVVTPIKIGQFTLYVYAYRKLYPYEYKEMVWAYLTQKKLRQVPKSGYDKFTTSIGFYE